MFVRFVDFKKSLFKLTILLLTLTFLCSNILYVLSSERVAGVKSGEWVEYALEWELPPYENYPVKVRREILEVNGSTINVKITTTYSNGTIADDIKTGDVSEGTGAAALMFIPANLTIGDEVRIQNFNNTLIQDEKDREYLGVLRRVVCSNFAAAGYAMQAYWDKIKGVALEIDYEHSSLGHNRIIIVDTNMFSSESTTNPPNWGFYFALATVIIIASILLFRWERQKSRKRRARKLC